MQHVVAPPDIKLQCMVHLLSAQLSPSSSCAIFLLKSRLYLGCSICRLRLCYQRLRHCLTVQSSCSTNEPLLNPHRIRGAMLFWKQLPAAWRQFCQVRTSDLRRGLRSRSSNDSSCEAVLAQGASELDSSSVIEHPLTSP